MMLKGGAARVSTTTICAHRRNWNWDTARKREHARGSTQSQSQSHTVGDGETRPSQSDLEAVGALWKEESANRSCAA